MSSTSIQSKDLGLLLLDGPPAKTMKMTSHVKSTRSSILPKILELPGNILRATFSISLGEPPNFLQLLTIKTSRQGFSSPPTQILEGIKEPRRDGTKTSTCTTLMTSSRPSIKPLTLETASS